MFLQKQRGHLWRIWVVPCLSFIAVLWLQHQPSPSSSSGLHIVSSFSMGDTIQSRFKQQQQLTRKSPSLIPTSFRQDLNQYYGRYDQDATALSSSSLAVDEQQQQQRSALKSQLIQDITALRTLQEADGELSIDFGVKGGELNATSRAPRKLDFYAISDRVGKAADAILSTAQSLAVINPTAEPTQYLGDKEWGSTKAPLHGAWKLLFSTAADATFSKNSTRGNARAQNVVDASRGRITNIIDFVGDNASNSNSNTTTTRPPLLKQLNVVLKAKAVNAQRVEFQFRYVRAVLTKFFGLPLTWSLYIPVPGPFITRCLVTIKRIMAWLTFRRRPKSATTTTTIPKAFFDILYLDHDLRIHKTGEENIFIQAKEQWKDAQPLLQLQT